MVASADIALGNARKGFYMHVQHKVPAKRLNVPKTRILKVPDRCGAVRCFAWEIVYSSQQGLEAAFPIISAKVPCEGMMGVVPMCFASVTTSESKGFTLFSEAPGPCRIQSYKSFYLYYLHNFSSILILAQHLSSVDLG
ncbi:hypothetical protein L6452_19599 [Arctium lappa]|uniref:Uncharacterized protein n=1 Tax=Arctium lappa TaxID=4217 RepID=A0ACB9B8A7_ARCLA|nr:hypothetical protein L6452_19599 [Arctium lappa]